MLKGKRILLIVAGGIAAFKSLELIRRLRERGGSVRCVLTEAGAKFVTPLSLQALSEDRVYSDMFSLTDESEMGHIQLSRDADLLVVAPATANILARMASGLADDLASTVLLATDKLVLAAPAMNVRMWTHAATVANVETLKKRGITFIGPNDGAMACNEYGPGRMSEPEEIVVAIETLLTKERPLAGKRASAKTKKKPGAAPPALELAPNPDILATLSRPGPKRPMLVVGFAAETENLVANAIDKRTRKGCDWIIANDVSTAAGTFGGERNTVHLISTEGVEDWQTMAKDDVALGLAGRIALQLGRPRRAAAAE